VSFSFARRRDCSAARTRSCDRAVGAAEKARVLRHRSTGDRAKTHRGGCGLEKDKSKFPSGHAKCTIWKGSQKGVSGLRGTLARTRGHKVLYRVLPDALEQLMWIPGATRLHKENRAQRGAEWIGDLVLPEHTTVRSAVASGLDCTQDVTYPTRQTSIHPDPRNHSPILPPPPVRSDSYCALRSELHRVGMVRLYGRT
jgi:hypothetical protein